MNEPLLENVQDTRPAVAKSSRVPGGSFDVSWRERLLVLGTVFGILFSALGLGLRYARDPTMELVPDLGVSWIARNAVEGI